MNPPAVFLFFRLPGLSIFLVLLVQLIRVPFDLVAGLAASGIAAIFLVGVLGGLRARSMVGWVAFERGRIVTSEPPAQGGSFGGEFVHARLVRPRGVLGVVVLPDPVAEANRMLPRAAFTALRAAGMPDVPRRAG